MGPGRDAGFTATVSYGVLVYAFAVFITPLGAELGWSKAVCEASQGLPVARYDAVLLVLASLAVGSVAAVLVARPARP